MALAHDMMTWLQKSGDEYTGFKGYNECRAYLVTFFKDRFSLTEDQLDQLKNADEADVYYRDELMEVLGITYWKWKVVWKKPDEMTEIFEDGQRRGKQNHYRQASKTEWSIPDSEVLKSEREDERRAVNFGN
jgi:hypothetical protein